MSSSLQRTRSLRRPASISASADAQQQHDAKANGSAGSPSRLPVKPPLQRPTDTNVTGTSNNTNTGTRNPTALRGGRVMSGSLQRSASTRIARTAQEPVKKEASRYPPSTTTTRSASVARPTSSSGIASQTKRTVPAHTRAKSTAASVGATAAARPPTQGKPGPAPARTGTVTPTSTTTAAAPRALHRKAQSVDQAASSQPPPQTQRTPPRMAATANAHAQPRLRPAFSTLQQHYSPAKSLAPKPLTATFLAPPSPSKLPANVAASAETTRLQAELLQLHLLDRDAAAVDAQWHASARDKLARRFAQLASATRDLAEQERAMEEADNLLALRQWERRGGLDEAIQALDAVSTGVWVLSEPGGRYARIVRRFERWLGRVSDIEDARNDHDALLRDMDGLFVGELDTSWKEECAGAARKLGGWREQLEQMERSHGQDGSAKSSMARMMAGCRALVDGMLAELRLMEEIEREALAREKEWIERVIKDDEDEGKAGAGAIWRAV